MKAREGDLIGIRNGVIFDVKGLVHPPDKVIAFPRYIPSATGKRGSHSRIRYDKVYNLEERFKYLQSNLPHLIVADPVFGERLCEVPRSEITSHYDPIKKLQTLREAKKLQPLEQKAVALAEKLKEASGIPWSSMGISGSVMAGLFTDKSDLDPIVYGSDNSLKAYAALQGLSKISSSSFKPYNRNQLRTLYEFRSKDTQMSFEEFIRVESSKAFQGKYDDIDFFVRFIKDWEELNEQYGDLRYENVGYTKLSATVADDSEALFTPCIYRIDNDKVLDGTQQQGITEIASFRGRFCQQAKTGEKVVVQGKVERVTDRRSSSQHYRVIIGNKPSDYMALLNP